MRLSATASKLLLVVTAGSLSLAAGLGFYGYYHITEIQELRVSLLTKKELQERLVQNLPSDHCTSPHSLGEIGFVLNPAKKQGSLWVNLPQQYAINSLGLRGKEIEPKKPGVKRILIVSDSWFWGWKNKDHEMLSYQLQQRIGEGYEVITVAMPAWNVRSEAAFLEAHYHILDPDFIVWGITQNDVVDTPTSVPPGLIAAFASTQSPEQPPFANYRFTRYPTPSILDRWEENIQIVNRFKARYNVPILVFFVHLPSAYLSIISERIEFDFPAYVDAKKYQNNIRWRCAPIDSHPSAWANSTMYPAVIRAMVKMDLMDSVPMDETESENANTWKFFRKSSEADRLVYIQKRADELAAKADNFDGHTGITTERRGDDEQFCMAEQGVLFLAAEQGSNLARLKIQIDPRLLRFPRNVRLTAVSIEGKTSESQHELDRESVVLQQALPYSKFPLYELRWEFDYVATDSPTLRNCATVISLESAKTN